MSSKKTSTLGPIPIVLVAVSMLACVCLPPFGKESPMSDGTPGSPTPREASVPSTQAAPTHSTSEDVIGNWRFAVLATEELPSYGYFDEAREGYKIVGVDIGVQNVGEAVETLALFQFQDGPPYFQAIEDIHIEDDRGFSHPLLQPPSPPSSPIPPDFTRSALLPPNYRTRGWIASMVPNTSSGLQLVITGKQDQTLTFDLEKDIVDSWGFPAAEVASRPLGEALTQNGIISITPLRAMLYRQVWGQDTTYESINWRLYIEISVENLYGYDVGIGVAQMQVFDSKGHTYDVEANRDLYFPPPSVEALHGEIREIPPGLTATGVVEASVNYYAQRGKPPEPPTGLLLLILLPEHTEHVEASAVYGVYDLAEPTLIDH
jgi:hypothetical protein